MSARRTLPESCYDFFVEDGRDGQQWGPFDTLEEAKEEAKRQRKSLDPWARACIELAHELSEPKIKRALAAVPRGGR